MIDVFLLFTLYRTSLELRGKALRMEERNAAKNHANATSAHDTANGDRLVENNRIKAPNGSAPAAPKKEVKETAAEGK